MRDESLGEWRDVARSYLLRADGRLLLAPERGLRAPAGGSCPLAEDASIAKRTQSGQRTKATASKGRHTPSSSIDLGAPVPEVVLSPMTFDRKQLAQLADWEVAAVAIALPWSTSATAIL